MWCVSWVCGRVTKVRGSNRVTTPAYAGSTLLHIIHMHVHDIVRSSTPQKEPFHSIIRTATFPRNCASPPFHGSLSTFCTSHPFCFDSLHHKCVVTADHRLRYATVQEPCLLHEHSFPSLHSIGLVHSGRQVCIIIHTANT